LINFINYLLGSQVDYIHIYVLCQLQNYVFVSVPALLLSFLPFKSQKIKSSDFKQSLLVLLVL